MSLYKQEVHIYNTFLKNSAAVTAEGTTVCAVAGTRGRQQAECTAVASLFFFFVLRFFVGRLHDVSLLFD